MSTFLDALLLQAGYNAALVGVGAGLLGIAAGAAGTFLFLRRRALVSDAIAHATLPGIGIAFMVMVSFGGDGRNLAGLIIGSAASAVIGLLAVDLVVRRTRLSEDAAIGAVLSVFFGLGIVLLTIIQSMTAGRQAGLETYLLGSTAGMLMSDALVIATGGAIAVALVVLLRRPMTLVAFDPEYAAASGVPVARVDLATMALVMAVTVTGLKIVGLILIVALLVIPPVAARFWSDRSDRVALIAGLVGGVSGYVGAAISASAPDLPTGPLIVLTAATLFLVSMLLAPRRGVIASLLAERAFQVRVHRRQGLLAIAHGEAIYDRMTVTVLRRDGLVRRDGVATDTGRALAARTLRDEKRWELARLAHQDLAVGGRFDGLTPIEDVLTRDEIAELDRRIGGPTEVSA